ncbi:MAG TPA: alpha/beta family hydrolase [Solirubrobacterales bacterium]|nr:alpha/beta family hydrolase [Solirubrobacterales bacterium]
MAIAIETPHGEARADLRPVEGPRAALVLGHGAGGGVEAPDLLAATEAARSAGLTVALVEQPYRVAGRRSPPAANRLDAAWVAAVAGLANGELRGLPLVVGGRSLGARVACRTLGETGAMAVLCLAFPLQPPARQGSEPRPSRIAELDAVDIPVLIVQGARDRFGMPPPAPDRTVVEVAGDHGLKADLDAVGNAVRDWLDGLPGL